MLGRGWQRRLALVTSSALAIAGLLDVGVAAGAAPPPGKVSFSSVPSLYPQFRPGIHDYVVRCDDAPVTVQAHVSEGWRAAIGDHPSRSGDFRRVVPLGSGQAFVITVREMDRPQRYRYYVRCLPTGFPEYTFTRYEPVTPRFFAADHSHSLGHRDRRYATIFNQHGVPMWWYHTQAGRTRVLPGGKVLWFDHSPSSHKWKIHRLNGRFVRSLDPIGHPADPHDLQRLGNGDYLIGSYVKQQHVDTSAHGGSSDATVVNTELQQVSPDGRLRWRWKSQDHIDLAETGRHWPWVVNHGYDIAHWNSVEPAGDSVIASFRHLDAVYKIRKSTGEIVWKLGGTSTPESLEVMGDSRPYTFGDQHDARLLSDGTVTVFDNRTNLSDKRPRAARFRIDEQSGTATLLESISDPNVGASYCCGSARRLDNGEWLIAWGKTGPIGGYRPNGERTFRLNYHSSFFSTRAEPVPAGAVSPRDLRHAMNLMHPAP